MKTNNEEYKKKNTSLIRIYVLVLILALFTTSINLLIQVRKDRKVIDATMQDIIDRLDKSIEEKQKELDRLKEIESWERFCSMENVECFEDE